MASPLTRNHKNNNTTTVVKNRAPAAIQISAEQIVREAADRQIETFVEPVVQVHDRDEYLDHLASRRKTFEDNIRYRREHIGNWVKYAKFEEENKELERARSVFERALEVDHRSAQLYLRYTELELRNECINHARNILDRAVQLLPRVDFLWYKYVWMEEMAGQIPKCRAVWERWMEWEPSADAWWGYTKFEQRHGTFANATRVLQRYCQQHPTPKAYQKYAMFCERHQDAERARAVYEAAIAAGMMDPRMWHSFAKFEEGQGEHQRARIIYQYALQHVKQEEEQEQARISKFGSVSNSKAKTSLQYLQQAYLDFEKKRGDPSYMESILMDQRREQYEKDLQKDPFNYNRWLELAQLPSNTTEATRDIYERAVAQVPPSANNKDDWRRYIYVWIAYAVYEEMDCTDTKRALSVYTACLQLLQQQQPGFTFAKIWIYASQIHIRCGELKAARQLLGRAIGQHPKKAKLYRHYIRMEWSLGELDRCRTLYDRYVQHIPSSSAAWIQYAALEAATAETDRCRAIYELAVAQEELEDPEDVWKAYIDFEITQENWTQVETLYERLLVLADHHVKVWITYAQWQATTRGDVEKGREVFRRADTQLRESAAPGDDRVLLLDAWRATERQGGTAATLQEVDAKLPRRIKRKRSTGADSWEEYFEYQFPDDISGDADAAASHFKLLEMAAKWKQQKRDGDDDDDDSDDDDDE